MTEEKPSRFSALFKTEDYWAVWLGFAIILVTMAFFFGGSTIKSIAVTPGKWSSFGELGADLSKHALAYLVLFVGFGAIFTLSMAVMG
ncbi:MAG: putative sulfate exporter family transporter, partial [Pseudomonadota bacterium]